MPSGGAGAAGAVVPAGGEAAGEALSDGARTAGEMPSGGAGAAGEMLPDGAGTVTASPVPWHSSGGTASVRVASRLPRPPHSSHSSSAGSR
ncbi:hypothetical protein HDC93_006160 [Streptomyces sp. AK010]|nr:hypothetical protein [Streptomyces sp. AK010]